MYDSRFTIYDGARKLAALVVVVRGAGPQVGALFTTENTELLSRNSTEGLREENSVPPPCPSVVPPTSEASRATNRKSYVVNRKSNPINQPGRYRNPTTPQIPYCVVESSCAPSSSGLPNQRSPRWSVALLTRKYAEIPR